MKLRMLPIVFASLLLVGCGSQGGSTTSASIPDSSTSLPPTWKYLNFLSVEHNLRVDLFDLPEGLQISYGDAALGQPINDLAINASSQFTINKNLAEEDNFNAIIVKEDGKGRSIIEKLLGIDGDKLVDFFNESLKDELKDFTRSYVAFSMGDNAKWTKGLNAEMDTDIASKSPNA